MPEPDVVQLGDLTITLVPLSELEALRRSIADEITATRAKATKLGRQAGDRLAEAGQLLLERRSEWSAAAGESAIVASATQLAERIKHDTERDFFMSAAESKEYGVIDEILVKKKEEKK